MSESYKLPDGGLKGRPGATFSLTGPATTANPTLYTQDFASHKTETKYSMRRELNRFFRF